MRESVRRFGARARRSFHTTVIAGTAAGRSTSGVRDSAAATYTYTQHPAGRGRGFAWRGHVVGPLFVWCPFDSVPSARGRRNRMAGWCGCDWLCVCISFSIGATRQRGEGRASYSYGAVADSSRSMALSARSCQPPHSPKAVVHVPDRSEPIGEARGSPTNQLPPWPESHLSNAVNALRLVCGIRDYCVAVGTIGRGSVSISHGTEGE
jgi:hypothetical protein